MAIEVTIEWVKNTESRTRRSGFRASFDTYHCVTWGKLLVTSLPVYSLLKWR